jgi:hypothetical protein
LCGWSCDRRPSVPTLCDKFGADPAGA